MVDRIWPHPRKPLKLRVFLSTTFVGMVDRRSQDEFDALVSFAFNVGAGAFARATLLKKINEDKHLSGTRKEREEAIEEVRKQLVRWNKSNGRELPGLTTRRASEAVRFLARGSSSSGHAAGDAMRLILDTGVLLALAGCVSCARPVAQPPTSVETSKKDSPAAPMAEALTSSDPCGSESATLAIESCVAAKREQQLEAEIRASLTRFAGILSGRSVADADALVAASQAERALILIENKRQFLEVNPDVVEHVDPVFCGDLKQSAFNALGLN